LSHDAASRHIPAIDSASLCIVLSFALARSEIPYRSSYIPPCAETWLETRHSYQLSHLALQLLGSIIPYSRWLTLRLWSRYLGLRFQVGALILVLGYTAGRCLPNSPLPHITHKPPKYSRQGRAMRFCKVMYVQGNPSTPNGETCYKWIIMTNVENRDIEQKKRSILVTLKVSLRNIGKAGDRMPASHSVPLTKHLMA
jgi:hypothetical protein